MKSKVYDIETTYCEKKQLSLEFSTYTNGRIALLLCEPGFRGSEFKATVNIPEADVPEGHVLLKGWSENEGIPQAMVKAGIVELTGRQVPTGFCVAEEAKLLVHEGMTDGEN